MNSIEQKIEKANKLFDLSRAGVLGEFVDHVKHNRTNSSDNVSKNRIFGLNKEN